jgi:hypothetical protein
MPGGYLDLFYRKGNWGGAGGECAKYSDFGKIPGLSSALDPI